MELQDEYAVVQLEIAEENYKNRVLFTHTRSQSSKNTLNSIEFSMSLKPFEKSQSERNNLLSEAFSRWARKKSNMVIFLVDILKSFIYYKWILKSIWKCIPRKMHT